MSKIFILLWMLFNHVLDDYWLQGILASMKQKSWWKENTNTEEYELYRYDYIMALIMHSISWTFMIMLPAAVSVNFKVNGIFLCVFILNAAFHGLIDHLKANEKSINLVTDQSLHIIQILVTFTLACINV